MPRSIQNILDQADELARRFESFQPSKTDEKNADALAAVHRAAVARIEAERELARTVFAARQAGTSWSALGRALGTSGQAARDRYGHLQPSA